MSRATYHARLRNLGFVRRPRTYGETRRLELEIALGATRGEGYRAMTRRLGCSHPYCWRVARRYRTGLIHMLPHHEPDLPGMRDALDRDPRVSPALPQPVRDIPDYEVPGRYRDVNKWKEQYYAARPWLSRIAGASITGK